MPSATQLHQAVRLRHYRRAQRLLDCGLAPNEPDALGRTPVHTAAAQCDPRMLELLLAYSSSTDACHKSDPCDMTPLHLAASRQRGAPCAALLLAHGAAPDAPGPFGVTPRLCAHTFAYRETEAMLAQHGGNLGRGRLSEISFRSLLAHLFGVGGTTVLHGRLVSLEAAYPEATFGLLGDAVAAYVAKAAHMPPDCISTFSTAAQALREAGENIGATADDLHQRIRAGQTAVLPCGVPRHCAAMVWRGGRTLWCDRLLRPTVREVTFPLSLRRLRALQCSGVRWHVPGLAWSAWLRFQPQRKQPSAQAWNAAAPKPQHVGNCAMASAKAALWALLAQPVQGNDKILRERYKRLTTYARYHYLHAYIARHIASPTCPLDTVLLERCLTKLLQPSRRHYLDAKFADALYEDVRKL